MRQQSVGVNQFLIFWILLTVTLFYGKVILIPLCFAILLAMLMAPVCQRLDKAGFRRVFSALTCILILLVVFVFCVWIVIAQVSSFSKDLPLIEQKLTTGITSIHNYVEKKYEIPVQDQKNLLQKGVKSFTQSSTAYFSTILTRITALIVNLVITLVITFLLLFDKEKYHEFFLRIMRGRNLEEKRAVLEKIELVAQKYLLGRALSMGVLFVLYLIALLLIGIKNALLLALMAALVNIIPYIGPILAAVLPTLAALITRDTMEPAIWVLISFCFFQAIDNYFVTPFVMGGEVSLSALSTILIIICGGIVWGIAGMILFIPMLSVVKIIFDHVEHLHPYGYLIGNQEDETPSQRFRNWVMKKLGK